MTENAGTVTPLDGTAVPSPGPAVRRTARRRPTGAPPPLPHPVSVSTTAWLVLAVAVLAGAILVSVRAPSLRLDDQVNAAVLRLFARAPDAMADRHRQRNLSGWLRLGGHDSRAIGGGTDDGVPPLAAPADIRVQPRFPRARRFLDQPGAHAAAPLRCADHRGLGRVLRASAPGGDPHHPPDRHRLLPGRSRALPLLRESGHSGRGDRVLPGLPVPGRRSRGRHPPGGGARRRDPGQRVPFLHPERGLPRRLPARQHRARRCDRPTRRSHPAGHARPARVHRHRHHAGRA